MSVTADYFIVQIIEDLFRREPRNIGVLVRKEGRISARFVGQVTEDGGIDKRQVRFLSNADVYVQWVDHWKNMIGSGQTIDAIIKNTYGNYSVVPAGIVSDTDSDSPDAIAGYLFSLLVSKDGLIEALGDQEELPESASAKLKNLLAEEFEKAEIISTASSRAFVPHPVEKDPIIYGRSTSHTAAYAQNNGEHVVMETVDFTTPRKAYAKDHAGWAAFMFSDIRAAHRKIKPVAIIRARTSDVDDPKVKYGMSMLAKTATSVVNWAIEAERDQFIRDRIKAAQHIAEEE